MAFEYLDINLFMTGGTISCVEKELRDFLFGGYVAIIFSPSKPMFFISSVQ